jgi:hypothetical protein
METFELKLRLANGVEIGEGTSVHHEKGKGPPKFSHATATGERACDFWKA